MEGISGLCSKYLPDFEPSPVLTSVSIGLALTAAILGGSFVRRKILRRKIQKLLEKKQRERLAQFARLRLEYKLNEDAVQIQNLNWDQLVQKLQTRQVTAVSVLRAFIAKSLDEAAEGSNAITDYNEHAMDIAKELDALAKPKGPLHGIPFVVKDDYNVQGMDTTLGFAKNCLKPADKTAALVLVLKELGGIPFCKSNVPQSLLSYGSDNPIFGQTTSAHNRQLGPGGSSSGTGALVGSFGSFFGTGTDLGGSVRVPAHFNGVAAIKPTSGRLTERDIAAVLENLVGMDIVTGIIGRDAGVVSNILKSILETHLQSKFDPTIIPLKWNDEEFNPTRKLRIGYYTSMPFFPSLGDTEETIERAVLALEAKGHQLFPIKMPDGAKIIRTAANFIFADKSRAVLKLWEGEQVAKCMKLNNSMLKFPKWFIQILRFLMNRKTLLPFMYSKTLTSILGGGSEKAVDLWDNKGQQIEVREEILGEWERLELDLCICPVFPFPALPLDIMGMVAVGSAYCMVWNLVDFPAGVVKFGHESGKNIDNYDDKGDSSLRLAKQGCKKSIGSPIGVQIVGLPYKEELVCRLMVELDQIYHDQPKM